MPKFSLPFKDLLLLWKEVKNSSVTSDLENLFNYHIDKFICVCYYHLRDLNADKTQFILISDEGKKHA